MHKTELDRFAIGLMVVLCTIWGLQQVAIKLASAGISPVWQAGLRSIGATVIVVGWALARGVKLFRRDHSLLPGLLAGALFAGEFALIFTGLQYTTASRGVIFLYTAPFFRRPRGGPAAAAGTHAAQAVDRDGARLRRRARPLWREPVRAGGRCLDRST